MRTIAVIIAIISMILAAIAIWAEIAAPELRCWLDLDTCSPVEPPPPTPSPPKTVPIEIVSPQVEQIPQ